MKVFDIKYVLIEVGSNVFIYNLTLRTVVVVQLVERMLPIPEDRGSNPVIGKKLFILNICLLSTVY